MLRIPWTPRRINISILEDVGITIGINYLPSGYPNRGPEETHDHWQCGKQETQRKITTPYRAALRGVEEPCPLG